MSGDNQIPQIGDVIVCRECGIPKRIQEFAEGSAVCAQCVPRTLARSKASTAVSQEEYRNSKFHRQLEELRKNSDPAVPLGVQKAHEILGGKTSVEIIAELIREVHYGKGENNVPLPKGSIKDRARLAELLLRSEMEHDERLNGSNPYQDMSPEVIRSVAASAMLEMMIENREERLSFLRVLKQRVPDLLADIMEVCEVPVFVEGDVV